jgi:pimeloyl-ACP methyl ester carboxylesterase
MTTWVLLRGLTREAGHWGPFLGEMRLALPMAQVVPVDLPGAGALRQQRCPLRVPAMVEACRAQLLARGLPPPYRVLGLSLGGMVASAWATRWPAELQACVLVNTSLRPFSPATSRLRLARWPTLVRLLLPGDALRAEQAILRLTSTTPERHTARVDEWVAIRRGRPVSTANALCQLLAAACHHHDGPPPAVPVLVVSSARDGLVDPACSHTLATAWNVSHAIHPDAGHDLPLDDGPWLAATVAEWSR